MADFNQVHSDYLGYILHPESFKDKLSIAESRLREVEFDAFAVRGVSGILFGGALADRMGKGIIVVRKAGEQSHSSWNVEGFKGGTRYIFLDDFTSTGATRERVKTALKDDGVFCRYKHVGDYLYRSDSFRQVDFS